MNIWKEPCKYVANISPTIKISGFFTYISRQTLSAAIIV